MGIANEHRAVTAVALLLLLLSVLNLVGPWSDLPSTPSEKSVPNRARPTKPVVFTGLEDLVFEVPDPARVTALLELARSMDEPAAKGEFEIEAAYSQRRKEFARPIGDYPRTTQFAIILPGTSSYDADKGLLTVSVDPTGAGAMSLEDDAPAITLHWRSGRGGSYIGQNAFGVARHVEIVREHKTLLIPIAKIDAPKGCNFRDGHASQMRQENLVDGKSFVQWACGLSYFETAQIEDLSRARIKMPIQQARNLAAKRIIIAYIVSFDALPGALRVFAGPIRYSTEAPSLDNPMDRQVTGSVLTARLHRMIVFTQERDVILDRSFA